MQENKEILENTDTEITPESDCDISEIESLQSEIAELKDKYLRIAAELENTRRRAQIDIESVSRNRGMGIAEKFLPLIDAIDAAFLHAPDDAGIESLSLAAKGALSKVGIIKIETTGQILNPLFHNAIQTVESDKPANTIVQELQSGYMFADSVLRPAMVVVAK